MHAHTYIMHTCTFLRQLQSMHIQPYLHIYTYTHTCITGKDGGCINLDSDTAIVQISSGALFTQNEAVGSGGVMYMCKGSTARVIERATFRGNTAATGGCVFMPRGSQVHFCTQTHIHIHTYEGSAAAAGGYTYIHIFIHHACMHT